MKLILVFAISIIALVANAAVPDYKAFRGTGGITITSNPPNGTIVIDGSAISAGATPSYAITNNYDAANTFTNIGQLRQSGFATFMGLATNNNDLTVRDALLVIGTNSNPFVVMNAHSNRTAQFLVQTYSDIEASPSAVLAGRDLGSLEFLGYGSANLELGAKFEVVALQNFAATESSSRILLHVGDSTGGANGYIASSWDANLMSNNVASFFKSNVTFAAFVDVPTSLDSVSSDSVVTVRSTDADQVNNVYLLNLSFVDNQDANAFYAKFSGDSLGAPTDDYVFGQTSFSVLPPVTLSGGITLIPATANRVAIFNGNKDITNHADMRLAASLSGAADGEVLKYHGASGTWSNGTVTGSASISTNGNQFGASVPITIKDGALLTNAVVYNELGQSIRLHGVNIVSVGANELRVGVNGLTNWALNSSGNLVPTAGLTYDIGGFGNMVRNITANTITNMTLAKPSIAPPGAGGLVHLNGTNQNWFVSATTNVLLVLTNLKAGVDYVAAISNGANVSVTMSNAAAIKVPSGSFPSFNTNGFTVLTFRLDDISASTNLIAFHSKERSLVIGNGILMTTNATTDEISIWGGHFTNSVVTGVGGANTNFTLVLPYDLETTVNGFTNVSIRAVMGYDTSRAIYWNVMITNYSGSDRTLEFSAVTNRWRFSGVYGTNAPSTLTNQTALLISGRSLGTNTQVGYTYFPGPL